MNLSAPLVTLALLLAAVCFILTRPPPLVWKPASDGTKSYLVKNLNDGHRVADHLQQLENHMKAFLDAALKAVPGDPRLERIRGRWDGDLAEVDDPKENIAYSLGKSVIHVCVRQSDGTLAPINSCFFVLCHELAHIATPEYGHTQDFWKNMRFLLELGEALGYYRYVNHDEEPQMLCGRSLGSSPVTCVKTQACKSTISRKKKM